MVTLTAKIHITLLGRRPSPSRNKERVSRWVQFDRLLWCIERRSRCFSLSLISPFATPVGQKSVNRLGGEAGGSMFTICPFNRCLPTCHLLPTSMIIPFDCRHFNWSVRLRCLHLELPASTCPNDFHSRCLAYWVAAKMFRS